MKKDFGDHSNDITTSNLDRGNNDVSLPIKQGSTEIASKESVTEQKSKENKGILIVDATVADQMIAYPTDLSLLSRSREESERLIDELCKALVINEKPRTYRRVARKQYLHVAKKKNNNKSKNEMRKAIGQQLRYLRGNLKSIDKLFDKVPGMSFPLEHRDQKI